jgi:Arc/MetJ family transcription regulator
MKTTIDIPDPLMAEARKAAQREGTTLRALVEEGLRKVLGERRARRTFKLRDVSFRGEGLQPGLTEGNWEEIRRRAYEGRGE